MNLGELVIFALAGVLAVVPALVDRWAVHRGASPQALIALATVTLAGVAAVPVALVICTGGLAGRGVRSAVAIAGLLLVAIAAGRTIARVIAIRRRWRGLARVAASLKLPAEADGVTVLPVGELLAFASGTDAYVSQGLIERLRPLERRAVIEHEREHAQHHHGRLLAVARALTHGSFGLAPAARASRALERELDVLADQAAALRLGDPGAVQSALRELAVPTTDDADTRDQSTQRRLERLSGPEITNPGHIDGAVRLVSLGIGAGILAAVCLSIHTSTLWLGVAACTLLIASVIAFTRPVLTAHPDHKADGSKHLAPTRAAPHRRASPRATSADRSCEPAVNETPTPSPPPIHYRR